MTHDEMITLKTLPEATEQEVFNQVYKHLMTQMEKSMEFGMCKYKGPKGLKCAAGCLIGDDEYRSQFDNNINTDNSWSYFVGSKIVPDNCAKLICILQGLHDGYDVKQWEDQLRKLAKDYNLEVPQ